MRNGLMRAIHHAQHRMAFGAYLIDQPLMRNVLADLAVEAEAATMLAMRMAGATDRAVRGDERETLVRRIGLAAAKYWVCKRATPHAAEAMECLGGNGYVEDFGMARLYREAPLMGIWEGSGNVSALDTLRAMATRPECIDVLFDELAVTAGQDPRLDAHVARLKPQLEDLETIQYRGRQVAEDISLALQGSLLVRHGHPAVAEAFLAEVVTATMLGGFVHAGPQRKPLAVDDAPGGAGRRIKVEHHSVTGSAGAVEDQPLFHAPLGDEDGGSPAEFGGHIDHRRNHLTLERDGARGPRL